MEFSILSNLNQIVFSYEETNNKKSFIVSIDSKYTLTKKIKNKKVENNIGYITFDVTENYLGNIIIADKDIIIDYSEDYTVLGIEFLSLDTELREFLNQ